MFRSLFIRVSLASGLVFGALGVTACSGEPAPGSAESATGSVSMPLLASAGAHTYRLTGSLLVNGPLYTYLDLNQDAEVMSATLPTGDYSSYLYWWALSRDDGSGNFLPVEATLSNSSSNFSIFNGTTTTLTFEFETDGQLVTVGAGSLNVSVEVSERAPLCTPLGDDCSLGTWCPPSELTGARLGCIVEGAVPVGATCNSPVECVANASCFDFGSGPVCAELCSSADAGQPCPGGGTCSLQGADYGVCGPPSAVE